MKIWIGLGIALGIIMCLALVFSFGFEAWRFGWTRFEGQVENDPCLTKLAIEDCNPHSCLKLKTSSI